LLDKPVISLDLKLIRRHLSGNLEGKREITDNLTESFGILIG